MSLPILDSRESPGWGGGVGCRMSLNLACACSIILIRTSVWSSPYVLISTENEFAEYFDFHFSLARSGQIGTVFGPEEPFLSNAQERWIVS